MKGRTLRVLASGSKRSVLVEFTDNGQREVVSRRALRPATVEAQQPLFGSEGGTTA